MRRRRWSAGIFRDVYLYAIPKAHIADIRVRTLLDDSYTDATLDLAMVKMRSSLYGEVEAFSGMGLANLLASFALFDDDPGLVNRLEGEFAKVTPALIQKTAEQYLRQANRTVLTVEPKPEAPAAAGEKR